MVKMIKIITILVLLVLSVPAFAMTATSKTETEVEMRGLWVATVVNIDYPSKPVVDAETLKSEALTILDDAYQNGFNTVFLQVRPTADSLYRSAYFPWSKYLTGKQGLSPEWSFDPLEFWVTEAHKRGLELHAWINPYRVTKKSAGEPSHDFGSLDPSNPASEHPEWVIKYSDGGLYFDPGIPEVRQLVVNGAMEIARNYDVDGIHLDDYFYPGKNFNDKKTYQKYGHKYKNIDDWRRANVDALITDLSNALKTLPRKVRFGISPFGIWANKDSNPLGSDTKGLQTYYDMYADSRKWVKEELIDYVAPQLYWNIGYSIADYSKLLSWWKNVVQGTDVDLYIGQAAYRAEAADSTSPWYGVSEIERQLQLNSNTPDVKGSIFFNYKALKDNPALLAVIKSFYERKDGIIPSVEAELSRPLNNISTKFDSYYLNGASDPAKTLYLNGEPVENRSIKGYFGLLVPLQPGSNIFTLSQEGSWSSRVIYRETPSQAPEKMQKADIIASSLFPQSQEYRMPGEKITLTCKAPIGSKVTVSLNGKTYTMKAATVSANSTGIFSTTFSYSYTVPSYSGTPRNINLGAPVYRMNYKGTVKTRTAPAKIGVILKGSPFYAEVINDVIDTYTAPVAGNGAAFELYKGMVDSISGMTGSYVRLGSGQWVRKTSVKTYTLKKKLDPIVQNAEYSADRKHDSISFKISAPTAALASFDGQTLKLSLSNVSSYKTPLLPAGAIVSSVSVSKTTNGIEYIFKPSNGQAIDGYWVDKTSSGIVLNIKRHITAASSELPLAGKTIMVDPGHGGSESGAIGPLGLKYAEKDINLNIALKLKAELEKLGASVSMTRISDAGMTLEQRLSASRKLRPDMFISVHANSMEDNVDISKKKGFSSYYREQLAMPLAKIVQNVVLNDLGRYDNGLHRNNFYVLRGTWTPSILVETGFVPNPEEFEWLTDGYGQNQVAVSISRAIVQYFSK